MAFACGMVKDLIEKVPRERTPAARFKGGNNVFMRTNF